MKTSGKQDTNPAAPNIDPPIFPSSRQSLMQAKLLQRISNMRNVLSYHENRGKEVAENKIK